MRRRKFLKGAVAMTAMTLCGAPKRAMGAAPEKKTTADVTGYALEADIKSFTNGAPIKSGRISLSAPAVAENGAFTPITIDLGDFDASRVALWIDNNPRPKIFAYNLDLARAGSKIETKIRVREISPIRLIAVNDKGEVYGDQKNIKVAIGGCG